MHQKISWWKAVVVFHLIGRWCSVTFFIHVDRGHIRRDADHKGGPVCWCWRLHLCGRQCCRLLVREDLSWCRRWVLVHDTAKGFFFLSRNQTWLLARLGELVTYNIQERYLGKINPLYTLYHLNTLSKCFIIFKQQLLLLTCANYI